MIPEEQSLGDLDARVQAGEHWEIPVWLRKLGLASWFGIGIVIAVVMMAWFVSTTQTIIVPFVIAVLLGAMLSPIVDRLERAGLKRWMGALACTLLVVIVAGGLMVLVVVQVVEQAPEIADQLEQSAQDLQRFVDDQGWGGGDIISSISDSVSTNWRQLAQGVLPFVQRGLGSLSTTALAIVLALNILFFILKDARLLSEWISGHLGVARSIGDAVLVKSARSIRGYFIGTTLVGLVNAVIVVVGAFIIGTPLAFVIGVVVLFTNYIPFIGAILGGAFAVLIAFGGGGWQDALVMLILVLVGNGPGQWVVQPIALGSSLNLHPIVVLFVTMAGSILAGPLGGVVAAPLSAIGIEAVTQIRRAGLFDDDEPEAQSGPPGSGATVVTEG